MYLRTKKRYTARGRKRYLVTVRTLLFWIFLPLICVGGWFLYQNRETVAPIVNQVVMNAYEAGNSQIATMTAPTPMPTENPVSLINRADMNWMSGRVEDAITEYEQAVDAVPNDVITHYNLAFGLTIDGRYEEALEAAERAINADPYASDAWAVRALVQARLGDAGGAIASGQHALQLNPDNAKAYAFLTEAYIELEQYERASESADQAVTLNPDSAEAYYARALVEQGINFDREAARADLEIAFDLAPYLTDAAVEMAYIDAALNEYDAAIAVLNEVKDANPDDTTVLYALGFMYYAGLGDPSSAADELSRCVTVDPESASCHYYYGRVLLSLERYNEAADMLARSVQLSSQDTEPNPLFNYWAGEAQIYLGNCPLALTYLRPGFELARTQERDELASDLQTSIRECQAFDSAPLPEPTETPDFSNPDETGETGDTTDSDNTEL